MNTERGREAGLDLLNEVTENIAQSRQKLVGGGLRKKPPPFRNEAYLP